MLNLNESYRTLSLPLRYFLAVAATIAAVLLRLMVLPVESGYIFLTFYPEMIVGFYLLGIGPGIVITVLSALVAHYIFIFPYWVFFAFSKGDVAVVNFLFSAAIVGTVVHHLQKYTIQLQTEAQRAHHVSNLYRALSEINQAIVRMDQEAELFPLVCRCAVDFGEMSMAWVGLLDKTSGMIVPVASYGKSTEILNDSAISLHADGPGGRGPVGTALRENRPVFINNYIASGETSLKGKKYPATLFKSTATFPITRGGVPFAVLQVFNAHRVGFGKESIALLEEAAKDISFALDNFDHEAQRTAAQESLRLAASVYAASSEGIIITDASDRIISVNTAFTNITGYAQEEVLGENPGILRSRSHDETVYQAMWHNIKVTGKWSGEILGRRKNGEIYPAWLNIDTIFDADNSVLRRVAMFTDITDRKVAEEEINHLAFYDHLTNLPNRLLFKDRLHQALISSGRSGRKNALLFIDLDNFKTLNDTLGHVLGDSLLQQVAERLTTCVREGDTVARLGGDEFVILLEDLSERTIEAAEQAEAVGEKILATLNQPYLLDTHSFRSSGSIGAIVFSGDALGAEELLKQADIAMYQAKKAGRNTLRFFDHKMQEVINARVALENELHRAIDGGQFRLHYQIQVDNLRRPLGAEALIRWMHPERGLMSPSHFIPMAEENGMILAIGQWVLETACAQLKAWQLNVLTQHLTLSVNVSAKRFYQTDFEAQVRSAVQRQSINPNLLKLELTESMLLGDIDETVVTMNAMKAIGVSLSLDDFGTGYSSLQYLKRLPLSQIKIDQSFVRDIASDPNDAAIVQTIIAMAETLGLEVIAEGVETELQREYLELRGCIAYQGFLFGRPVPIEQFEQALQHSGALLPGVVYNRTD